MPLGLRNPLCVALDGSGREEILGLARSTAGEVGLLKVGLTAIHSAGSQIAHEIAGLAPVFIDVKLHDIPAQVEGAVAAIDSSGAWCVTVHASGGRDMVAAAVGAANVTRIIAVTVLTSLDDESIAHIGMTGDTSEAVTRLAEVALEAGAHGVVCSAHEIGALRRRFGDLDSGGPLLIVPGIRPEGAERGDQSRVTTPRRAIVEGADVIVVGRPVARAPDPGAAARRVLLEAVS